MLAWCRIRRGLRGYAEERHQLVELERVFLTLVATVGSRSSINARCLDGMDGVESSVVSFGIAAVWMNGCSVTPGRDHPASGKPDSFGIVVSSDISPGQMTGCAKIPM